MRWLVALSIPVIFASSEPAGAQERGSTPSEARAFERIKSHYATGDKAQASVDAEAAADESEFSLITSGGEDEMPPQPLGVTCLTPYGQSPASVMVIGVGHVTPPETGRQLAYGVAYNQALVERADYPFRDLCLVRGGDHIAADDPRRITKPARTVTGPPRDLFDAARRGQPSDVRRQIKRESLNKLDSMGMTALAWAVARNNQPAIAILLAAGANPWVQNRSESWFADDSAVYYAAALGRRQTFLRLQRIRGRPFENGWPSYHLAAAMNANDSVIFGAMLAQKHEEIRFDYLRQPLPNDEMFRMAVRAQRDLATPLLFKGVTWDDDRPALVRMALANGADPNADDNFGTALWQVASGIDDSSLEVLDMLLKAGADPNKLSDLGRPIWRAFDTMRERSSFQPYAGRARVIFDRLVAAGADLNLPDHGGLPPIWHLLFPYSPKHDQLDSDRASPADLEVLVAAGLNLNAEWQGKRVMSQVEDKAPDSELAKALRKLGAKP